MHFICIWSLIFQCPKVYWISMLKNEENCSRNCSRVLNFASLLHFEERHIEKLLQLCVPKVSYWATTICIGACYCEELCTNQLHQSRIVVRFNHTLVDSCTLKKSTKKSSPIRLDMGLDRSVGSTIGR